MGAGELEIGKLILVMIRFFHIVIISFIPFSVFSQYLGGDADGFALNTLTQTVCPPLPSTNIYFGGDADGFALNTLTQTVCPPLPSTNIYFGGDADGFALNTLTQTVCPPLSSTNIYFGGDANGFALNILTQTGCTPLPIELLFFDATCDNEVLKILWVTASEINNNYFTLERSEDAINFEPIATIKGAGNSSQILHYQYIDNEALYGVSYYRLKQTDFDGAYEYFNIIAVNCNDEINGYVNIYPNPVFHKLIIEIEGYNEILNFEIVNAIGVVVYNGSLVNKIEVNTTSFSSGIYLIKIKNGNSYELKKIIKE